MEINFYESEDLYFLCWDGRSWGTKDFIFFGALLTAWYFQHTFWSPILSSHPLIKHILSANTNFFPSYMKKWRNERTNIRFDEKYIFLLLNQKKNCYCYFMNWNIGLKLMPRKCSFFSLLLAVSITLCKKSWVFYVYYCHRCGTYVSWEFNGVLYDCFYVGYYYNWVLALNCDFSRLFPI